MTASSEFEFLLQCPVGLLSLKIANALNFGMYAGMFILALKPALRGIFCKTVKSVCDVL